MTLDIARDTEFRANDRSGLRMIAGNHHRSDSRTFCARDGLFRLVPRRIDHADQSCKDEIMLDVLADVFGGGSLTW